MKLLRLFFAVRLITFYQNSANLKLIRIKGICFANRGSRDGSSSKNFTPWGIEERQFNIPQGSRKIKSIPQGFKELQGVKFSQFLQY